MARWATRGVPVEIKELGHLVLYVRDLDRSVRFYRDVLGWRQILGGGDDPLPFRAAAFSAPSDRTHHELLLIEVGPDAAALPAGRRVGLYHFGLKVGDSDDELREGAGDPEGERRHGARRQRPHGHAQPLHRRPRRQRDRALHRRPRRRLAQRPDA